MSTNGLYIGPNYLRAGVMRLDQIVKNFENALEYMEQKPNVLVGTGMSGALVVPLLAHLTGLDFFMVRSPSQQSRHTQRLIVGTIPAECLKMPGENLRWLFVDDLIETGATVALVKRVFGDHYLGVEKEFLGVYCYDENVYTKYELS